MGSGDLELVANAAPVTMDGVAPMTVAIAPAANSDAVSVTEQDGGYLLDNGRLRVTIDNRGVLTSVRDLAADREVVPPGQAAGLLQLHNDRPTQYEAWDIDDHYRRGSTDLIGVDELVVLPSDDGSAAVRISRSTARSTIGETITLRPGAAAVDFAFDIDWHEERTILKLAFPVDCIADRAASEIQFGHVYRPTHENTSWERAKFETSAHRWVHVGEPGWGVAVANDSTYGHDIHRTAVPATGAVATTVRLSLLRGPKFPDPQTDQGLHTPAVSLVVGAGHRRGGPGGSAAQPTAPRSCVERTRSNRSSRCPTPASWWRPSSSRRTAAVTSSSGSTSRWGDAPARRCMPDSSTGAPSSPTCSSNPSGPSLWQATAASHWRCGRSRS